MYMWFVCTCVWMSICTYGLYVHMHGCQYVHVVCVYMWFVCTCVWISICTVHMDCIYMCMNVNMYYGLYVYVCMCVGIGVRLG